jgi:PAS domain S-box-containing protein
MISAPLPESTVFRGNNVGSVRLFVSMFLLLSACIAGFGWFFYLRQEKSIKEEKQAELSAIADMKAEQIITWRAERLTDAAAIENDPFISPLLEKHVRSLHDIASRNALAKWLSELVATEHYRSVTLFDNQGKKILSFPDAIGIGIEPEIRPLFDSAISQRRIMLSDLHKDGTGPNDIHFDLFVPVFSHKDKDSASLGIVDLDIDPSQFLYPLIQSWPIPSRTGEVLLVRKDGDSVLYLNELRHRKKTALSLRLPLGDTDLPASRVISGFASAMEGIDYRSQPVLAVGRAISGTPWFMIAKIDKTEAFAAARRVFVRAVIAVALLILFAGTLIAFFQRHRSSMIYKRLYFSEKEKADISASLADSETRFRALFESMTEGVALHEVIFDKAGKPADYRILAVNSAYEKHTGLGVQKAKNMLASELYGAGAPPYLDEYSSVALTGKPYRFETFFPPLNRHFAISVFSHGRNLFATVFEDITDRKLAEKERETTIELLHLLNARNNTRDLMKAVSSFLQTWSGCEAVGIRLKEKDDYPYFETRGFPPQFVALESSLCARDLNGQLLRDEIGNPVIECMCGNVICGRFDSSKPFFTKRGSFWSNCTTDLLATTTDADRQARTRNRCNGEGYESVALIALRFGEAPLGLIQINDKRKDRFSLRFIEQVERFADSIAIALAQRRTQAELASEKERLLVTLRSIGDGVITTDTNGMVTLMNGVAEQLTGWTTGKALGKPLSDVFNIINEQTRARCENPVEKVMKSGLVVGLANHTALVSKDGSERAIADSGAPIRDASGEIIGVVLVFRDVTERRLAEQALKESEDKFRRIYEQSSLGKALSDKHSRFVSANPAFCNMLGYTEDELKKLTFRDITHPDNLTGDAAAVEQLIRGEIPFYKTEKKYVTKSGGTLYGALTLSSLRDENDEHQFSMVILENITEKKRAEDALVAEKERLAVTLRSIGDAVIATDVRGNIVVMNKVAEQLTGFSLSESEGRPLADVFHIINENTRKPCENPVDKVLGSGLIVGLANHTALISKDGSERAIADSGAPIRDKTNVVIGVVLVFRDITGKLRQEAALQNAEKLESLGVLAGGIAHDFNNLLSGLFGYLDLARESVKRGSTAADYLEKAFSVFGRAKDLTGQLLTFSKGGAPAKKTHSLSPLIRDAVHFALSGSPITSRFEIENDLWPCDVDENQMGQVLDNIIINARDAMPVGGAITVSAENIPAGSPLPAVLLPGNYVRVSIADQGTGIAPEHLPRIFDPFFTTKQKGSGLGLATSYSIVRRHEGIIEAHSELGKGATFLIYLPASASHKAALAESKGGPRPAHKGSGRVLVMDDEDFILDTASAMLAKLGYSVETAAHGAEAIDKFTAAKRDGVPFCLVILDLTIPGGMGGKETGQKLLAADPAVRLLASSGYSEDPVISHPEKFGFKASLVKPYRSSELAGAVAKAMG